MHGTFPAEALRLLSGSAVLRTSTNTKAYKLLDQNSTSTLVFTPAKCLQGAIIALSAFGLQRKRIKNKRGGKNDLLASCYESSSFPDHPSFPYPSLNFLQFEFIGFELVIKST